MQEHVQVDSSKCKACRRCEFACIASHHGLDIKTAMKMKDTYSPRCWAVKGDGFKTSVRCHCCNPAPCVNICPTGALEQHKDGSFTINIELCAGCMMCMSVCPYGVITPEMLAKDSVPDVQSAGDKVAIAVRCDLCHDWRIEKGVEYTACMEACTARALVLVRPDGTLVQAPVVEKKAPPKPAVTQKAEAPAKEEAAVKKAPVEAVKQAPKEEAPKQAPVEAVKQAPKEEAPKQAPKEAAKPAEEAAKPKPVQEEPKVSKPAAPEPAVEEAPKVEKAQEEAPKPETAPAGDAEASTEKKAKKTKKKK